MPKLYHIVAVCCGMGIGNKNDLPWPRNKPDMEHFKRTTNGKVVVMGRKTFDSIPGGGLPNRVNIVITKNPNDKGVVNGTVFCRSIKEALEHAKLYNEDIYIIGGAQIYKQTENIIDGKIVTVFDRDYKCDTYLPSNYLHNKNFELVKERKVCEFHHILHYERVAK